jgi:hypothetical protein
MLFHVFKQENDWLALLLAVKFYDWFLIFFMRGKNLLILSKSRSQFIQQYIGNSLMKQPRVTSLTSGCQWKSGGWFTQQIQAKT